MKISSLLTINPTTINIPAAERLNIVYKLKMKRDINYIPGEGGGGGGIFTLEFWSTFCGANFITLDELTNTNHWQVVNNDELISLFDLTMTSFLCNFP